MQDTKQDSTIEIGNVRLALRDDLTFSLQKHGDQLCYLIEDEKCSKFYRIGLSEYKFISLLDGETSIQQALRRTASLLGADAFTEHDAAIIGKWLVDCQLAYTATSAAADRQYDKHEKGEKQKRLQRLNPLAIKIPLWNPDRWITDVAAALRPLLGYPLIAVWAIVVLIGGYHYVVHSPRLSGTTQPILSAGNLTWLLVTWLVLKTAHELSHAVVCKTFGGHVRETGVVCILFVPLPFVDVTSSWRFSSKWKRILTSLAGILAELFIAAIATVVWSYTEPGLVHQLAFNIMVTATLVTVIFNANPLMKFDGYYVLSDLLEIPNLQSVGQQYVRHLGRKYLLGVPSHLPTWPSGKSVLIKIYGVTAYFWRWFICATLAIAAATLFHNAGIVLTVIALVLWLGVPAWQFIKYLFHGDHRDQPNLIRFLVTSSAGLAVVVLFLMLPQPGGVRAPAVVAYTPLHVVRAPYAGFINSVPVRSGEVVGANQIAAVMENRDLTADAELLEVDIEQSELRSRLFRKRAEIAALQVEGENRKSFAAQYDERKEQLANSEILITQGGRVVTREVGSLLGRYVHEGQALYEIGTEFQKELRLSISQDDFDFFAEQVGKPVDVYLRSPGCPPLSCQLSQVDPRASRRLKDEALASVNGGMLTVRPAEFDSAQEGKVEAQWELIEPRFAATVRLSEKQSSGLRAGQLTTVRLDKARGTIGELVYRSVADWLVDNFDHARRG